jgi:uncharacterized protein YjbI with pentapeptide repeats
MVEIKHIRTGRVICRLEAETLVGADLAGRDLTRADFHGADLSGASLEVARVCGADFAGANLEGARMAGVHYAREYFDLPAHPRGATLLSMMLGREVAAVVLCLGSCALAYQLSSSHDTGLGAVVIVSSLLVFCVLSSSHPFLHGRFRLSETANLRGACLRRADLTGACLTRANLEGADLRNATLNGARLSGANLRGADLEGAQLNGAVLGWCGDWRKHRRYSALEYPAADLRGANLRGADLSGASLRGTDLRGADLRVATLSGAGLSSADLREADLRGADLQNNGAHLTNLSGVRLQGAWPDATTSWPRFVDLEKRGLKTPEEMTPAAEPRGSGDEVSPAAE